MSEPISAFRVRVEEHPDSVVLIASGELDIMGAPRLVEAMPDEGHTRVIVDLSGVGFMDSSGLRALLESRKSAIDGGRPFALARPSAAVSRVLELVDLTREFEVVEPPN